MTLVTGGGVVHRYISSMKPFHLAVLIVAAASYFMLSAMIAVPEFFFGV